MRLLTILIYTIFALLTSCENYGESNKLKEVERQTGSNGNDLEYVPEKNTIISSSKSNLQCHTEIINYGRNSDIIVEESENKDLEYWESIIKSTITYKNDTLDLYKLTEQYLNEKSYNLSFSTFKRSKNKFVFIYSYQGCAGEECSFVLKLEFTINDQDKIIFKEIYHFDLKSNKREL